MFYGYEQEEKRMCAKELSKVYDPKEVEQRLYDYWQEKGYFRAEIDKNKKPFTIVIPPPNITGQLHMGHALDNMMQDAIIRAKRMQGFSALWLPGTDHASIATEAKIVDKLRNEGTSKEELGREKFLERAWEWKRQYGGRIVEQLKKLGSSCDWSRERFTMDEGCSRAVTEFFVRLYRKGLIYKGDRIINWCPVCETALSDAEVEYTEHDSYLWYFRYPAQDGGDGIVVATTRPETMLGDTAVAVNPKDARYKELVGKNVILPIMNRPIPVVADEYVDMLFGTGAVKITPAHDPNDFEVAERHGLPAIRVLDDKGYVNKYGGKYEGVYKDEARKQIAAEMESLSLLDKTREYKHNVGHCYRCDAVVEPVISKQWFVSMKSLAQPAIKAVRDGEIKFVPKRSENVYFNWLENIRDWCISRQLWWGHRIPAWYCQNCGEMAVGARPPESCGCGFGVYKQDEDVLDTWFSSGLWPFSTLGWPDKTDDLEYFYPTNVLVTGYDILFFWVARMIMSGYECMGEKPFEYVSIHGLVRDSQGRKMSKSLGNGIDPLELIERYGADALRFSLAAGVRTGGDMRFSDEKVLSARNFANKLWNAARFVLLNSGEHVYTVESERLDTADKWIISRLSGITGDITSLIERFELGMAAQKLHDFIWSEYCDWYIEMAKPRLLGGDEKDKQTAVSVLVAALKTILKLLHPFMPFITEEIYQNLPETRGSIMVSGWPLAGERYPDEEKALQNVMELIRGIRNIRANMDVPHNKRPVIKILASGGFREDYKICGKYIERLALASGIEFISDKSEAPENAVSVIGAGAEAFMALEELIDIEKEQKRLSAEERRLNDEIARAGGKLENKGFIDKAPESVVRAEREKLETYRGMLDAVRQRRAELDR
ncbi:MAG: valine--tRNA ligase [Christensenellales bacterium]